MSKSGGDKSNSPQGPSPSPQEEGTSVDPPLYEEICSLVGEVQEVPEAETFVPKSLPLSMCERAPTLHQEDFDSFFKVQENAKHLESGEVSSVQLVALYLRSFKNVLEYDLNGLDDLSDRYIKYFGNILADILEICYPHLPTDNHVVSLHK